MHPAKISGYVRAQSHPDEAHHGHQRFITLSRQYGTGGYAIGELILQLLNAGRPDRPWELYDKNLVDKIIADHKLSEDLRSSLEEHQTSKLEDWVGSVLEGKPPQVVLVQKTAVTVRSLALRGHAVIMGRGGFAITHDLPGGVHVRLIAPVEDRIDYTCRMTGEGRKAVRKKVERIDKERREFVHAYHGGDLDDPTQFHLVLNTSRLGFARCARIIAELLIDQG
jgi:hypothetical protein